MSTTPTGLAGQLRALLDQARSVTVPGGMLAWWGRTDFPDGTDNVPTLTQAAWTGWYRLLENAAITPDAVTPLPAIEGATREMRPDGPLPIAIANFRVAVPDQGLVQRVRQAAASGNDLADPPPNLGSALTERQVFAATGYLHDQWGRPNAPVYRGRRVTFILDEHFHLTNHGGSLPDAVEVDLDDDQGLRAVAWGEPFQADYGQGASPEIELRCRYGDETLTARFTVAISDEPAPPAPDETWRLEAPAGDGTPAATGCAWVFRREGRRDIVNPVILVEGFPGRHPCDYLYELFNQAGTVEALHRAGYDLVIVGLDNGLAPIESNAGILVEAIREARCRTSQPLVVGGVSMGGLVSRIALAQMEEAKEPHSTRVYLSIDAPHRGTYTSLGVQWFVQSLRSFAPSLNGFSMLLNSPSNQELMIEWLDDGLLGTSPRRDRFVDELERLGYPEQPRTLAVSCGRGDGIANDEPGALTLEWSDEPFAYARLHALPGDDGVIAQGSWFLGQPPELAPIVSGRVAHDWDTAPGSRNTYNAQVVGVAKGFGCGRVEPDAPPASCCVPTVSALDLDQDPFDAIQPRSGPFDAHVCSDENEEHLVITPKVSQWILDELGLPCAPAPGNPRGGAHAWDPATFNPHDPGFLKDPYPTYARFREQAPSFAVGKPYDSRWFFRYADCYEILANEEMFRKFPDGGLPADANSGPISIMRRFRHGIFTTDPPRHCALKDHLVGPLYAGFKDAPVLAARLADDALGAALRTGYLEVVADYALPVPAEVLFDILGIPADPITRAVLIQWQAAIVRANDKTLPDKIRLQGATAAMALHLYLQGLVRQYEREEPHGVIGVLAHSLAPPTTPTSDDGFTSEDVFTSSFDFVVAGYLSTTWLVTSAILSLFDPAIDPGQRVAFAEDPSVRKNAMWELLRYEPPLQLVDRYVKEPCELGGKQLRAREKVTAVIGSANRDEARFEDPDVLDIHRSNAAEQMSFGEGIHRCIGEHLAMGVAPVLIAKLLELPGLTINGLPQWLTDPFLRGMTNLPVRFRPSADASVVTPPARSA
jgi:cytochrome P450